MILLQTIIVYGVMMVAIFYGTKYTKSLFGSLLIPTLIYSIIMGLRYGVGIDYFNYYEIYEMWQPFRANYYYEIEAGYGIIMSICKCLGMSFPVFLFFISFFQIIIILYALKDFKKCFPYICLALILTGIGILTFTNGIRQCLAFPLFVLGTYYISRKNYILYVLIIFIAFCLHKSALILLPIIILTQINTKWLESKIFSVVPFLCFILLFMNIGKDFYVNFGSLIEALHYEKYISRSEMMDVSSDTFGFTDILFAIVNSYIIYNIRNIRLFYKDQTEYVRIIYVVWFIGMIGETLFKGSMMMQRIFLYFTCFKFIIYGLSIVYAYSMNSVKIHKVMYYFILFTLFFRFSRIMYYAPSYTADYIFYFQEYLHQYKHSIFF